MSAHDTVGDEASTERARTGAPTVTSERLGQLRRLLSADHSAVVILGLDGTLLDINDVAKAGLGVTDDQELEDGAPTRQLLRSLLDQVPQQLLTDPDGGVWHGDVDLSKEDGLPQVAAVTVLVHHEANSPTGGFIAAIARDVTDAHRRQEQLVHALDHDPVTGLLNRRAALLAAAGAVGERRGGPGHVAIFMIDVDLLRDVNDALGHEVGDRLLASTARRLSTAVRPTDVVARVGGDEFLVLCHEVADADVARELADRIRRALTGRLSIRHLELEVSVSVGVAVSDQALLELPSDQAAIELLSHADTAVHAAKRAGRGRTMLFTDQLRSRARERTELAAALARALHNEELSIEYQPIFSAVSEQVEAVEALLRWNHPTRGRIDAGDFVSIAEETGVIVPIGEWVLHRACADARALIDSGVAGPRFAVHVNVSRLQFSSPSFVSGVVDRLREYRLRPRQLVLEAREATLLGDVDEITRSVRALRRVGVRVALDNFGTGANALSILTDIGADVLKLDGGLALPSGASDAPRTSRWRRRAAWARARSTGPMPVALEQLAGDGHLVDLVGAVVDASGPGVRGTSTRAAGRWCSRGCRGSGSPGRSRCRAPWRPRT
jgi:diguanylate cyclase (GGDEF)-like protein